LSRYKKAFDALKKKKEGAIMPFAVIGDPDYETSLKIVKILAEKGDMLELGIPFSDPIADGPTIQRADARALKNGFDTDRIFDFIREVRKFTDKPIGLLVYYNLMYQYGVDRFCNKAKESGADSILAADLSLEESNDFIEAAGKNKIDTIFLVTQLTNTERLKKILERAKGFVYIVNVLGVTGARADLGKATLELIKRVRVHTKLSLCAGFGISKPEHVKAVLKAGADGAIVGSAIVKIIEENQNDKERMLKEIEEYLGVMKGGVLKNKRIKLNNF